MSDIDSRVEKYDNQTKLDITAWVISKIDDHGNEPGSFRYLIYDRLGFGPEAYVPLYEAGGMNITNELDYNKGEIVVDIVKKQKIDNWVLKRYLNICDEPGCYEQATCGWPAGDDYRRTCGPHYLNKPQNNT